MAKKVQPAPSSGPNALQWVTLVAVVVVGAIALTTRQSIDRVKGDVDARIANIDARVAKMQSDVASAAAAARQAAQAQTQRRGPDPARVYALNTGSGTLSRGNPSAPVTIVEVSDFQ